MDTNHYYSINSSHNIVLPKLNEELSLGLLILAFQSSYCYENNVVPGYAASTITEYC
jgi:hypothetical protein